MTTAPLILWFRRDLRLADHPMLSAAVQTGRPLVPVFLLDPQTEAIGAAAKWRLGQAIEVFQASLAALGSRLILRRGETGPQMAALIAETGATGVWWQRRYDPVSIARDSAVKHLLRSAGLEARSFAGAMLLEPWQLQTGAGGPYRVFSPFWTALRSREIAAPDAAPTKLISPDHWPASDLISDWHLGKAVQRGAAVLARHAVVGEAAARFRLDRFLAQTVESYADQRDRVDCAATSDLSENLTTGEIGPRTIWHEARAAMIRGAAGAEAFLRQLAWRDFATHLFYHFPHMDRQNWRPDWEDFAWRADNPDAERWRRGMTGEPFVDAAMRQMYVTGRMHNRARLVAASYLTKHLLTDWRVGLDWFADCLTDWDPASNAMGWQWVAGCGPDAAPYFRIFNPATQAEKFDPDRRYRNGFLAECAAPPVRGRQNPADDFFDAVPKSWQLDPNNPYPQPVINLSDGRLRALAAYQKRKT